MRRNEQIRPFPGAWPSRPCSLRRTPSRVRKPGPSPLRSLYSARKPGPSADPGQRVLRPASVLAVHRRMLIERSSQFSLSFRRVLLAACNPRPPSRTRPAGPRYRMLRFASRSGLREIPDEPAIGQRSLRAQRSRDRPAAPGSLQTVPAGVQVSPPARPARRRVGDDLAVNRHYAKQVRLGGPLPAPDTRPDH